MSVEDSDDSLYEINEEDSEDTDVSDSSDDSDNDADDDPIVKAFKTAKKRKANHPADIVPPEQVIDVSFHPGEEVIALGSFSGDIYL